MVVKLLTVDDAKGAKSCPNKPFWSRGKAFPKQARVRNKRHYQKIFQEGLKYTGQQIGVDLRRGQAPCPKLGVTVSKRHGKAHERNRFKRLVREAFRHSYPSLPQNIEINVFPKQSLNKMTKAGIQIDLESLCK